MEITANADRCVVALLAEGVDRNSETERGQAIAKTSPSSRRAWIEIDWGTYDEERDESPSSRRAWIEIFSEAPPGATFQVALLAEGVDRN